MVSFFVKWPTKKERGHIMTENKVIGYLPDEKPTIAKSLLFAVQQFLVMLPATVLAALLMKFNIPTAIFASGVATLVFLLVTKGKIPLYFGSSFSYIPAVAIIAASYYASLGQNLGEVSLIAKEIMGPIQVAIALSGVLSVIAGVVVKYFGQEKMEKVLPPHVTGPVAAIIGLSLAGSAISNSFTINAGTGMLNASSFFIASITLLSIIAFTVFLRKGFIGQLPILLGILVGILATVIIDRSLFAGASGHDTGFKILDWTVFSTFPKANWNYLPAALLAIVPIALVTIPESTAHVYQLDLYVNDLAERKGVEQKYDIKDRLGDNLIGDGICDVVATFFGGPAGTNYGENISASAVTRVFSTWVFALTALLAIIFAFTPLADFASFLPGPVTNGASIYLFGVIAAQGITLMIEKKVDMFNPKNLAIIAVIFVVGLGGHYALPNGGFPLYKVSGQIVYFPAIAIAAIVGILLNALLSIPELITYQKSKKEVVEVKPEA